MDRFESLVYGILASLQGYKSEVGGKDEVGDYTVSTVNTIDAGWETAIWKGNGEIVVVARYATKEEALQGHQDWIEVCKLNPTTAWSVQTDEYVTL
jgi:hypothetical protein